MKDFYHKKVVPFENYLAINFNYQDIDIILKGLELLAYNIKNVYLMKEDNASIYSMSQKISILYNLILSNYTLHIDKELERKEKEESSKNKLTYCRFKLNNKQLAIIKRNKEERRKNIV